MSSCYSEEGERGGCQGGGSQSSVPEEDGVRVRLPEASDSVCVKGKDGKGEDDSDFPAWKRALAILLMAGLSSLHISSLISVHCFRRP